MVARVVARVQLIGSCCALVADALYRDESYGRPLLSLPAAATVDLSDTAAPAEWIPTRAAVPLMLLSAIVLDTDNCKTPWLLCSCGWDCDDLMGDGDVSCICHSTQVDRGPKTWIDWWLIAI
jgi:hypothetical protein